jgi:hypothetical protein
MLKSNVANLNSDAAVSEEHSQAADERFWISEARVTRFINLKLPIAPCWAVSIIVECKFRYLRKYSDYLTVSLDPMLALHICRRRHSIKLLEGVGEMGNICKPYCKCHFRNIEMLFG